MRFSGLYPILPTQSTKIEIENYGTTEAIVYGKNWLLKDEKGRMYTPNLLIVMSITYFGE
ncbi:MAG: hypothetical protein P8X83_06730 [Nitrosopumilaceae archaeon]